MYEQFIRKNKTTTRIIIFIISFIIIQRLRPAILYNRDGSIRPFGIGRIFYCYSYLACIINFRNT